jgi:hypothetical protein
MKFAPEGGDVGVIGNVDFVTRNSLGSVGIFLPNVTANGYSSAAQNLVDVDLRYLCTSIPDGLNSGDAVTADIAEENGTLYAENMEAL